MKESVPRKHLKTPDIEVSKEKILSPREPEPTSPHSDSPEIQITESEAEVELDAILNEHGNEFLSAHPKHIAYLDSATAIDALGYVLRVLDERLRRTFHYEYPRSLHSIQPEHVSYRGIHRSIEKILHEKVEIGRGGDAFVVIDKSEIRELPPEICYKFSLAEATPRGRNDIFSEMDLQEAFYVVAQSSTASIGVPMPFYAVEIGHAKVIAMEKLNASSIDDILRHKGTLPAWIDIDVLCDELRKMLDAFHNVGLFHRDMHFGNIMISQNQRQTPGERMAYIIDFGISTRASDTLEPYKKEVAGSTFTYTDDYAILEFVKLELRALRKRRNV